MAALVAVATAQLHLKTPVEAETDLSLKVEQASDIIREYLRRSDDGSPAEVDTWTETTVPPIVQAAVLLQITDLYLHRGDERAAGVGGAICPAAEALLRATGYRDPALA